jgi:hypothetical protein
MKVLALFLFCMAGSGYAQTGSEIILFDLKAKKKSITLSNPQNITNHPGYDNQPSFHTDEPIIYYASFNDQGRSDIKAYNFETQTTTQVTNTPEREYSPTLTPDKTGISCIIQRDNGAQDLGKYPLDGTEPYIIIDSLVVGYHVWTDNSHLALFVLGKKWFAQHAALFKVANSGRHHYCRQTLAGRCIAYRMNAPLVLYIKLVKATGRLKNLILKPCR